MKVFSVACAMTFALISLAPVSFGSDREEGDLKGPVKDVRVEETLAHKEGGKLVEAPRTLLRELTFDRNGNETGSAFYPDGHMDSRGGSTFDSRGRKTESKRCSPDGDLWQRTTYSYDSKGHLVESVTTDASGVTSKWRFVNDEKGNPVKITHEQPAGSEVSRILNVYNARGHRIECKSYNKEKLAAWEKTTYDTAGRRATTTSLDPEGKLVFSVGYAYNKSGNVVLESCRQRGSYRLEEVHYQYEHDARGNWIRRIATAVTVEPGKLSQDHGERIRQVTVTYRTICYY